MKTTVRRASVALIAVALLAGCGKKSETASPITRAAMPANHSLDFDTGFVADDLTHGIGATQLTVNRRWSGTDTLNTHFGSGWSDQNVIQLTLVSRNVILLWRGGVGWLTAHRNGEKLFEGDAGEKIEQTDKGWTAHMPHGVTLTFDTNGRLISKKPATGPACNYSYDKSGRLVSMGTGSGNELKYRNDKRGRVTRVDGPEGLRLEYNYDDKGQLAAVENSRKIRIEYRYADKGKLVSAKDQLGNELELARIGPIKRSDARKTAKPDSLQQLPKYDFDAQGRITSTAEGAASKSYEYDEEGRTSAIAGPEGRASCKYDAFGRIESVQNANGTSSRFEYNNLDLPIFVLKPDGRTEKLKYDEHGRLLRRERSPTDWEELSYDNAGRIEMRRTPPAAEEHYVFGDADRVARVKYSSGREASFEYDPAGRVLSESWSSGEKRMWRYDADGRLAESVGPTGLKTTYRYDAQGQMVGAEDSIHGQTSYRRSPKGDVIETAGGKTARTLTEWGKPLEIVEPGGARTVFNYDGRGLLERVLSPMNVAWRYEYNPARKLTAIVAPSGLRTSTTWDAAGRRTKVARGNVAWREYHYNSGGRVEQEYSGIGRAARYAYDKEGQVNEVELPDGKVAYTIDKGGRRFTRKGSGYQVEDQYNGDGTLLVRKYKPAGLDVKLPLDSAGRAAGIELNNLKVVYGYGTRGQIAQITLPGGTAIKVVMDDAARPIEFTFGKTLVEKISYDRSDRIIAIEAKQTSGKNVFSERYAHDAAGNLSQRITDSGFPAKFEYDRESRLTRGSGRNVQRIFTYDVDGNLTTNGDGARCQIDNLGRPIQQGPTSYSWDAGGNLTLVQTAKGNIENVFDAAGRLVERRDGKNTWKFGYDSGQDRLWEQGPSGKRWYAYLDDRIAGWKDEAGTTWLIVSFPGTDRPLAICGSNGKTLFVLHDRICSARRFVDPSGAIVASDDYTAFGNLLGSSGKRPIGIYAGMVRDETGLFYARRRYYDSTIARFISIDPLIGTPGTPSSHNPYAYAANNPLRYRDPMGTGSFEDEVENYHQMYDYVYKKDPRDPTGNTPLKDAKGDPIPETHQSGPFKGEPIVDKSKPPVAVENNGYSMLTGAEQNATRQAYEGAKAARQTIQNPSSTAEQVAAASETLAQHEAELARLHEISNLRYGHALCLTGTEKGFGGANSDQMMANYEKRMAELGADPLEHYSNPENRPVVGERASAIQAEADAAARAARDARAGGAFERGSNTQQVQVKPGGKEGTGAVGVNEGAENAGNQTLQVKPGGKESTGAAGVSEGADTAGKKTLQVKPGTEAGETAAGESNALVPKNNAGTAAEGVSAGKKTGAGAAEGVGDASGVHDPGILKDGSIRDIDMKKGPGGTYEKKPSAAGPDDASHLADAEDPFRAGGGAKGPQGPRDVNMVYDAEKGVWKPAARGAAEGVAGAGEAAGERWLGPKILEAGGKLLKPLGPLLKGVEILQTAEMGGTMAKNFIDNLNQPFMEEQKEKQGARWVGERLANELRKLAAADPDAVVTGDGHKFDPNNPKDLEELMLGLSQNLYFHRKPFDGLLTRITNKPTSFMGPADGDTAASYTLDKAWKLMQTAITVEKAAGEAAKECIREQNEAKSQLQTVMTMAGGRAVAESDLSTLPETAKDAKTQTANVKAQTKAVQGASEAITAAVGACDAAATKICDLAQRSASATADEAAKWKADATSDLFAASNALNTAQATVDKVDSAVDQLRTSIATLDGFRSSLTIYKMGSGAAEGAGIKPDAAFTAAKAAAERASAARDKLGPMLEQLRNLGSQISNMLVPYMGMDAEAVALAAAAQNLGSGIESPSLLDIGALITLASPLVDVALTNQRNVEKAIGNVDIDGIINGAREALTEADGARSASALGTGPERYRSLQTANQCLAAIGAGKSEKTAEATPAPTASPAQKIAEEPAQGNTPEPIATLSPQEDLVDVPFVGDSDDIEAMKAAASAAGFAPTVAATSATPPAGSKRLFADQNPKAGTKAQRGKPLTIVIYQKIAEAAATTPTPAETASSTAPSLGPTSTGTVPNLIGLTLSQATSRLTGKMRIGGDEVGDKPPTADKAFTIFSQYPSAGTKIDLDKEVAVAVKRYGSAEAAPTPPPAANRFDGRYRGSYTGTARTSFGPSKTNGAVSFTVSNGAISITSPGSGSGNISDEGHGSFGGGTDDGSAYKFSGSFTFSGNGASAGGSWSATFDGGSASGTWSAAR